MAASPDHVFAMKALAARTRDIDDLKLPISRAGSRSLFLGNQSVKQTVHQVA